MSTLQQRLAFAFAERPHLTQAELARACGLSGPSVSNWFTGETRTLKAESARLAALYIGCDRDWLATGRGTPKWVIDPQNATQAPADRGQPVLRIGPQFYTNDSPIYTFRELQVMGRAGPSCFQVRLPDDSMAPRLPTDQVLEIDREGTPTAGSGVLVRDSAGALYFRAYRPTRGDSWEAYPLNPAYQTLDVQRDQLEIVGVLRAIVGDRI